MKTHSVPVDQPRTGEGGIPPIIEFGKSDPFFFEQIKALRAKVEYKLDMQNFDVLAVTSAVASEGKTLLCANLAVNLALSARKKVLLIDVDHLKTDLSIGMAVKPVPGLTDFLTGTTGFKDIIRNSYLPGINIIPGGNRIDSQADLLTGEKFRSFLKEMKKHFDIILLDTPPVLPIADALSLRDQVDRFILIYRAGSTPHGMFRQAVEEIGEEHIMGVVMNGLEPNRFKYYQRYYGKYYHGMHKEETSG